MRNEPETAAPAPRKLRIARIGLVVLVSTCLLFGWREYAFRRAAREIQEAGFDWAYDDPIEIIRRDWRAVFRADTWRIERRGIVIDGVSWETIAAHRNALERLRPLTLAVNKCTGEPRLDVIGKLQTLRFFSISACGELRDLSGLEGLSDLGKIVVLYCPNLENLDGIKGLINLKTVELAACPHLTRESIAALESALPKAAISHDFQRSLGPDPR